MRGSAITLFAQSAVDVERHTPVAIDTLHLCIQPDHFLKDSGIFPVTVTFLTVQPFVVGTAGYSSTMAQMRYLVSFFLPQRLDGFIN